MRSCFSRTFLAWRMMAAVCLLCCGGSAGAQENTVPPPKWLDEVAALYGKGAFKEALKRLDEVPEEERKTYLYPNLKGSMLVALRRFPEARLLFKQSLELSAGVVENAYHPKFNLAEINLVEKKWAEAEAGFKELLREPWRSHKTPGQPSPLPLVYFKVGLCQITTKRNAQAAATYKELKGLADDQAAGASEAMLVALDFQQKSRPLAMKRLAALRKDRPKKEITLYEDSFVEMGWLKRIGEAEKPAARPK
ncbi:MAG: hypothetical protein V4726_02045 [Verrucomicrobiota bacterium]